MSDEIREAENKSLMVGIILGVIITAVVWGFLALGWTDGAKRLGREEGFTKGHRTTMKTFGYSRVTDDVWTKNGKTYHYISRGGWMTITGEIKELP